MGLFGQHFSNNFSIHHPSTSSGHAAAHPQRLRQQARARNLARSQILIHSGLNSAKSRIVQKAKNHITTKIFLLRAQAAARSKIELAARTKATSKLEHHQPQLAQSKIQHKAISAAISGLWQSVRNPAISEISQTYQRIMDILDLVDELPDLPNKKKTHKILETLSLVDHTFGDILRAYKIAEKKTPDFDRTKTGRDTKAVETDLENKLVWVTNKAKARLKNGGNMLQVRTEFSDYVNQIVGKTVTDSYMIGANLVANATGIPQLPTFEAQQEIQNIVRQHVADFWHNLEDYFMKLPLVDSGFISRNPDIYGRLTIISTSAAISTLAFSTILNLKTAQTNPEILAKINVLGGVTEPQTQKVMWITERDDKVCPICEPLDGTVWDIDDPTKEEPPKHPNCRCKLAPVFGNEPWVK